MAFQFEEDEAIQFGDREAVLIHNFRFWIRRNKANNHNFFDGRTWTWNKNDAFAKLFRFWTKDQVRRLIESLVKQGVIMKGNYNSNPHDRTCWYAFVDEEIFLREPSKSLYSIDLANLPNADGGNAKSSWQKNKMDLAKLENPVGEIANYITDNKPYNNPSSSFPTLEEAKKFAEEEDLKIDVEEWHKFSKNSELKNWKNAMIGYAKNPKNKVIKDFSVTESLDITRVRQTIQRIVPVITEYDMLFRGCRIDKTESGYTIFVSDAKALKYETELAKINIKIEVR